MSVERYNISLAKQNDLVATIGDGTLGMKPISNLIFSHPLEINKAVGRIRFQNCLFEAGVHISLTAKEDIPHFTFTDCESTVTVTVYSEKLASMSVLSCKFGTFDMLHGYHCKKLSILGSAIESILILEGMFDEMEFAGLSGPYLSADRFQTNKLSYSNYGSTIQASFNGGCVIETFYLKSYSDQAANISLSGCNVGSLHLQGIFAGEVVAERLSANALIAERMTNRGAIKLIRVFGKEDWRISVKNSNLGAIEITSVNFEKLTGIEFEDSTISEIKYYNVTWCSFKTATITPRPNRELFRQLKVAASNSQDIPTKLLFQARETDEYRQEIKQRKGLRTDRWILRFNWFTNRHGQNWLRSAWLIFATIVPAYFLIKTLLGYTLPDWSGTNVLKALGEMGEIFNPVRKFADSFGQEGEMDKTAGAYGAKVIDILFLKVWLGLLIFQMVKAFRKYVEN